MINGRSIEQVQHAKLLGITLYCHLTWEKHIDDICSIVNSRLSLLRRIKPFLNHHCTLRFYNSCIHNLFIYSSSAWGSCSSHLLSRLLRLQKRAAKLLLNDDFSQPSVSLFSKLKRFPIFDLIKIRKLVLLSPFLVILMLLFVLNVNSIPCLPFVQLVCAPELTLLIFKFHFRG